MCNAKKANFSKSIACCTVDGIGRPLVSGSNKVSSPTNKLIEPKIM